MTSASRISLLASLVFAATTVAVPLSLAAPAPSGRFVDLAELTLKGHTNTNPSIAAEGRFVVVTWAAATKDGATDIYVAGSRDAGRTFGRPTRVNDASGQASISGEQPPRVTVVPHSERDSSIVVVWTAKAASGTRLLSARSDDGGMSFGRATPLPGSNAAGNRGWESLAVDRKGRVLAIWLDHRELALRPGSGQALDGAQGSMHHDGQEHTGHGDADGVARAALSKLFFASLDGVSEAKALTGGVCYCCKTALATGADGAVYAAWRHVYPGNIRDIAFTVSRDGGQTFAPPIRVSEDRWVLDGCPENGPAIAVDNRNRVHVVWPTLVMGPTPESEPTLAMFYATSRDGRRFTPRQQIPTSGLPRHPQIAIGSRGSVSVTWDEQERGARRFVVARATVDATGAARFKREGMSNPVSGVYPVIAASSDGFLVAWASGATGESVVRVARLQE